MRVCALCTHGKADMLVVVAWIGEKVAVEE